MRYDETANLRYKLVEVSGNDVSKVDMLTRNGWEIHSWEHIGPGRCDFMFLMEQINVAPPRWKFWRR